MTGYQRLRHSVAARLRELRSTPALWVLVGLFVVGIALRVLLEARWRPAFIGYPDSGAYVLDAIHPPGPFFDPLRIVGYGEFLRVMRHLSGELFVVTVLQHALGVLTAGLLYGAMLRAGVRSRWAAIPAAAVVLLGGAQIMFEHALLSESLWAFLVVAAVYGVVRAQAASGVASQVSWSVAAGLLLGVSVTVRLPSLLLVPVLLLWLVVYTPGGWAGKTRAVLPGMAVTALVLLGFQAWHEQQTGRWGFTRNGPMNVYGRVAPWADCTKFTAPAGTEFLCETTPVRSRQGHDAYLFAPSPATGQWGLGGLTGVLPPEGAKQLSSWSRAAILGQPLTYLHAVAREARRLIDPNAAPGLPGQTASGFGLGPESYFDAVLSTERDVYVLPNLQVGWPGTGYGARGDVTVFRSLERWTRPPAWLSALAYALAIVSMLGRWRPERRAALLFAPLAIVGMLGPVVISLYDWRYVVPMLGFLAAAAGIGGWGVVRSTVGWWAARRAT